MTEREKIIHRMVEKMDGRCDSIYEESEIHPTFMFGRDYLFDLADAALRVIEESAAAVITYDRICDCGQSGYPENSPHSNHPHRKGCPQYAGT